MESEERLQRAAEGMQTPRRDQAEREQDQETALLHESGCASQPQEVTSDRVSRAVKEATPADQAIHSNDENQAEKSISG